MEKLLNCNRFTEATRRYRARHPDRVKAQRRKQHLTRKVRAFLVVGGAVCRKCGCDEIEFLEFNHKNGGGCKDHKNGGKRPMVDRILTQKRDTTDLECLCRVCNALDYLGRKNPESVKKYKIRWEDFTGQKAVKING